MKKDNKKGKTDFKNAAGAVAPEDLLAQEVGKLASKVAAHIADGGVVNDNLERQADALRYFIKSAKSGGNLNKPCSDDMSDREWLARNPDHIFGPNFR